MSYTLPLQQFLAHAKARPDVPFLHQPVGGEWTTYSWSEVDVMARKVASGLYENGLVAGDRVAILGKNSAEWLIADIAILMAGMISVPIYATAGAESISHVLEHSGSRAIFVGKLDNLEAAQAAVPADMLRIAFPYPTLDCNASWQEWLTSYEPLEAVANPGEDDIFSIVYTSGSTGLSKGVVLTQLNAASSSASMQEISSLGTDDRGMSYLPLAHITERCVLAWPSIYAGSQIYFNEGLETFISDLQHIRPTVFISVPRLWSKFQSQILAKMPQPQLDAMLSNPEQGAMASMMIKQGMGLDQVRVFGSGSAPISKSMLEWYETIGIEICEGWGMTETSGMSCSNIPFNSENMGTIGNPAACVEMKLSDVGEILIRGEAIFGEYYKNPQATAESFDDGWFHTGDKGVITENGSYKITGRIKEQFKTAKGKYVAPVPIESALSANTNIEQVCVMGLGRSQPVAVVVLGADVGEIDDAVIARLQQTLDEVNSGLESHQVLAHILIADEPWGVENGLLTPTLKLLRDKIEARYATFLAGEYDTAIVRESDVG